jgi:hypothetical protein
MRDFCQAKGIVHRTTNPYSSQENGVAERLNRTLVERARALLDSSGLEKKFWAEAVHTVNYLRNRTISRVHGKTPLEVLTGEKPSVSHLRVFGSKCFVHVPQEKRKKLDPVAEEGILIGYKANSKGYRILRKSDGGVQVSKDVKFLEAETVEDGLDELGGARDLSRVSPLDSPGAGATPTGEASAKEDPEPEGGDENGEILMLPEPNERELGEDAEPQVTNNAADPRLETVERKYRLREHRKPNSRYPAHEYSGQIQQGEMPRWILSRAQKRWREKTLNSGGKLKRRRSLPSWRTKRGPSRLCLRG